MGDAAMLYLMLYGPSVAPRLFCDFSCRVICTDELPPEIIKPAAEWNNNLPRKISGYRTPAEAFAQELAKIKEAIAA
ncbi:MAG: hypothetical protein LBP78_07565 [Acidaminococcales bacterium]|jgi:hypothetical protein|nr:hypothetical protein [Acidaminococcales bacterium]